MSFRAPTRNPGYCICTPIHSFTGTSSDKILPWKKQYYTYILASRRNGTLYTGITGNLEQRISEHKSLRSPSFVTKYKVTKLVYYEEHTSVHDALSREKQIKGWKRKWKLELIESVNPVWEDLSLKLDIR